MVAVLPSSLFDRVSQGHEVYHDASTNNALTHCHHEHHGHVTWRLVGTYDDVTAEYENQFRFVQWGNRSFAAVALWPSRTTTCYACTCAQLHQFSRQH